MAIANNNSGSNEFHARTLNIVLLKCVGEDVKEPKTLLS